MKWGKQSVSQVNRAGVYPGDIVAFVACLSFDARDSGVPFDSMRAAVALREQLHAIAGRVSDETFLAIANICGELLNDAAQEQLADYLAKVVIRRAQKDRQT